MSLLPTYPKDWLRYDIVAGLTTAAVVIPKAMAFATIAGLPIEVGLYTALVPMIAYALLGTARQLSVSTTTVIALLTATELSKVVPDASPAECLTVASTLAFLVGAFLLLASLLRLGFLAYFISDPVLTGFKAGIGLIIIVDQIPKLLGVHFDKGDFAANVLSIARHLSEMHGPTLLLGLTILILLLTLERFLPRSPAPLVAVAVGIIVSVILGVMSLGIETVGAIPARLPSFSLPDFSLIRQLWPGALGIALMSFTESIAAGRAFMRHGDPLPKPNKELYALGAANLAGGFFQILPAGGGMSQTAVNSKAGARTQLAELVTAAFVIVTLLVLAPLVGLLPQVALAAIVIGLSASMVNPVEFRSILRVHRPEFFWAVVALAGVLLFGALEGILVAVVMSLLTLLYKANHPPVYALGRKKGTEVFRSLEIHPDDEIFPGLLFVRTEGMLTFASVPRTSDKFKALIERYSPKVVVLDLSAVPDIEYTALLRLRDTEEKLRERGMTLWLAALNPRALATVERSDLGRRLGHDRMFYTVEQAMQHYLDKFHSPPN